jgi:hypothetical protein
MCFMNTYDDYHKIQKVYFLNRMPGRVALHVALGDGHIVL